MREATKVVDGMHNLQTPVRFRAPQQVKPMSRTFESIGRLLPVVGFWGFVLLAMGVLIFGGNKEEKKKEIGM